MQPKLTKTQKEILLKELGMQEEKKLDKCQKILISNYHCSRKSSVIRITNAGKEIKLCSICDKLYGDIIGDKK